MPELPEVEIIVRGLRKKIVGKEIVDFSSRDKKVIQFKKSDVVGRKIEEIERYAKLIAIHISDECSLLVHLKMTGQFIWEPEDCEKNYCLKKRVAEGPARNAEQRVAGGHPDKAWFEKLPTKHTRGIFVFSDKSKLYFNDVRRFGWIKKYKKENIKNKKVKELEKLGVEPFSKDFNAEYLKKQAKRFPEKKIKLFLMDQSIIAGVGNIYANEGLYFAGIIPTRKLKNIKKGEWEKIVQSIIKALKIGIKYGGTSDDNYVNAEGVAGSAQDHLKVYRREGEDCQKCKGKIEKIKLGGRGTFYCSRCQR